MSRDLDKNESGVAIKSSGDSLFQRVVSILERARGNAVRSFNVNMFLAYWLIGWEIFRELQQGEERAEYVKKIIKTLSAELSEKYGDGFSFPNLKNSRQFYQSSSDRLDSKKK